MKLYFSIKEYIIRPDLHTDLDIIDKIVKHHLLPMNVVRRSLDRPIIVSKRSGFRHPIHEQEKGRNLTSTHLFEYNEERQDPGYGASDYRVAPLLWSKFIRLMQQTPYSRMCFYPNVTTPFLHCDYRFYNILEGKKLYYVFINGKWTQVSLEELYKEVEGRFN